MKPAIEIDGSRFDSLDGFFNEVSNQLVPGRNWGRNLDAFNDILRGGFGTPEGGFTIRWVNFQRSRETLGYKETVRYVTSKLQTCHPANDELVREELKAAEEGRGPTVLDVILEIIKDHGAGGREEADGVELELA